MTSFDLAIKCLLAQEDGYIDDPDDPGGATNWGICQRDHPDLNIQHLTREEAIDVYRRKYWEPICGNELPPSLAIVLLDGAVNQGVGTAVRILQGILGVRIDGVMGHETIDAAWRATMDLLTDFQARRLLRYASLKTWPQFGLGWARRALRVHVAATLAAQERTPR